jgi:hypothetical protein
VAQASACGILAGNYRSERLKSINGAETLARQAVKERAEKITRPRIRGESLK